MAGQQKTDTIAAIATAPGVGGIGIIRISGPQARKIFLRIFRPFHARSEFDSHKLYYGTVLNDKGHVLDEVLAVFMQGPGTYTREDVVELHSHGSYLVLQSILNLVLECGARPAEAGEFTKRAFLGGRIDLTKAEAVIELLQAKTQGGVELAVNQMQGKLFATLDAVRSALVSILALIEVAIDFPEDDVEILDKKELVQQLDQGAIGVLEKLLSLADQGKVIREGVHVVIAGRPNVGKSSLLNALLQEERALVTDIPGTTRDTIEEMISINGIPVHLIDTAGIRAHDDLVEELGIERARKKLAEADLVLFMIDAAEGVTEKDRAFYETVAGRDHLVVVNKGDIAKPDTMNQVSTAFPAADTVLLSAREKSGIDALLDSLYHKILDTDDLAEKEACAPNLRHQAILEKSLAACQGFKTSLADDAPADLLAVELQTALDHLGDIVGLTTPEDVLDTIFSQFCIGK